MNRQRNDFNLSNKFEYGHDDQGGAKACKEDLNPAQMADCVEKSAIGHNQREENKEKIERQNFTIKPEKTLVNSDTKYIGTHNGKGIDNIIDQDDLRAFGPCHVPFDQHKNKD